MTLLEQLILTGLRSWHIKLKIHFLEQLDHGSKKDFHPNLKLPRFDNQKDFYDIARNSTDS